MNSIGCIRMLNLVKKMAIKFLLLAIYLFIYPINWSVQWSMTTEMTTNQWSDAKPSRTVLKFMNKCIYIVICLDSWNTLNVIDQPFLWRNQLHAIELIVTKLHNRYDNLLGWLYFAGKLWRNKWRLKKKGFILYVSK